jgi:nucleoside 2-deoxyribosyltransferase
MSARVYLAGPEVFLPNAAEILERKRELTRAAGLVPVSPGDLDIPKLDDRHALGLAISRIDEELMDSADAIIANLTPFRGLAADTGTCFELGYMCGGGRQVFVFAYSNVAADHYARTMDYYDGKVVDGPDGRQRGPDGLSIEDFDMTDNLMLDGGIERRGGVVVRGNAPLSALYTDMAAFETVLAIAAKALLGTEAGGSAVRAVTSSAPDGDLA